MAAWCPVALTTGRCRQRERHRVAFITRTIAFTAARWLRQLHSSPLDALIPWRTMRRETVLVVDDEPTNLMVLSDLLRPTYTVRVARDGPAALRAVTTPPQPDLVLLDVMMPGMDGFEVLRHLQRDEALESVPVLFLTALADADDEERGLNAGAADYITKPIRPAVVRARVRAHLDAKRLRDVLRDQNSFLHDEVQRRVEEVDLTEHAGIRALAHLAETRDTDTGVHIDRTQRFVEELAHRLRDHPRFRGYLTPATIELMVRAAPLHDVGKVGIPDSILLKPGPLTAQEWSIMQRHTTLGEEALARAERDVGKPVPFLPMARCIARSHHERWDGSGYPDGLAGDEIPIPARLMAVADVFDALLSKRVYKDAMPLEQARRTILEGRGSHFDPDVVDAFEQGFEAFERIAAAVAAGA